MKTIILKNSKLKGTVVPPASKSLLHRYIIAASMAKGLSKISNINLSEDINATIDAMRVMGAKIIIKDKELLIDGSSFSNTFSESKFLEINCNESGSTLRFMIPLSLVKKNKVVFYGKDSLFKRPLEPYFEIFNKQKINYMYEPQKIEKLRIGGMLESTEYEIVGNISSQFITGLLFALPFLKGDSNIKILGNLESKSYIDLTLECLEKFGIKLENNGYQNIKICGSQKYEAQNVEIESDFSQAAFFIVANSLGSKLNIENCNKFSLQGDKEIISLVEKVDNFSGEELIIDGSNCPDIIPIFSLKAAYSNKKVKIINVGRLRIKECDRLKATVEELSKFGFDLKEEKDSIVINYREKTQLKTEKILASSHNDHRIAMMLAIVSTVYQGEIILDNADCVKKSYPDFWEVFSSIGGKFDECLGE